MAFVAAYIKGGGEKRWMHAAYICMIMVSVYSQCNRPAMQAVPYWGASSHIKAWHLGPQGKAGSKAHA